MLFAGAGLILLGVTALTFFALLGRPDRRAAMGRPWLVIGAGLLFPLFVLTALLVYTLPIGAELARKAEPDALRVEVTGKMWWWEVRYGDPGSQVVSANEIHIPAGKQVEIIVDSTDVIHSFWVPNLAGKIDMIPGHRNALRITADRPGVFRGQCAEYCGAQHANMVLYVVAHPPDAFEAWLAGQRRPAREPVTAMLQRGRALFLDSGCGTCHVVRGLVAGGRFGPDLTHVGSRRTIAAGILPNNIGTLAGWIAGSQSIKPGNHMPSFNTFDGQDLRALAAYLASLE